MSRLTLLHINIIGVVVAIIVAVGMYYVLISPAQAEIETAKRDQADVLGRAAKLEGNRLLLKQAEDARASAERRYAGYEGQYMPIIGYKQTRMETMIKTFWPNRGRSWPERFIRTFRRHMAVEARANKVVWMNPGVLQLGPYGPDPNTINAGMGQGEGLGENGALHYIFQMQVRAPSLAALMRHIRDWNTVRGMGVPVVEGLTITGNSPNLMAAYNVALTIIVHESFPKVDPRVGGTGGGGGGGARQGGAMGMMGGPPMGMGGPRGMSGPPMGMSGGPMMSGPPMGMSGGPMMSGPPGPTAAGASSAGGGGGRAAGAQ